jgi:hypothetical protein
MPRPGKRKKAAPVEEDDGLKVKLRRWVNPGRGQSRGLVVAAKAPLPVGLVGMGIARCGVDALETVRFGKSRNAEVIKGPIV